ncbi:MAG: response regulator [Chloroflexi bacterium]|nr:MAG: response regulator [Chloroflexota bacterium]
MNQRLQILSIEDDPEMSGLIQLIFERLGHRVIGAKRGEFGLEFIKSLQPDILLLDIMLPDINGWEIYRQMKEDEDLADIPVIIVSARSQARDAAAGLKVVGNDQYVEKPFDVQKLVGAVDRVLEAVA